METTKKVSEVFSDYKQESNITNATIQQMNLIKKANVLEMKISSDEYLELKDLWFFEQFLRERFQFANVDIKIHDTYDYSKAKNLFYRKRMDKLNSIHGT